jgi:hypothetical protein
MYPVEQIKVSFVFSSTCSPMQIMAGVDHGVHNEAIARKYYMENKFAKKKNHIQ